MYHKQKVKHKTALKTISSINGNVIISGVTINRATENILKLNQLKKENPSLSDKYTNEINALIKEIEERKIVLKESLDSFDNQKLEFPKVSDVEKLYEFIDKKEEVLEKCTTIEIMIKSSIEYLDVVNERATLFINNFSIGLKQDELDQLSEELVELKEKNADLNNKIEYTHSVIKEKEELLNSLKEKVEKQEKINSSQKKKIEKANYKKQVLKSLYAELKKEKDINRKKELIKLIREYEDGELDIAHKKNQNIMTLIGSGILVVAGFTMVNVGVYTGNPIMIKSGYYIITFGMAGIGIDVFKHIKNIK